MAAFQEAAEFTKQRPGESDIDYRRRMQDFVDSRQPGWAVVEATITGTPDFKTKRAEDEALLKAREETRQRTRRRLGPSGYGNTILTSPLGVPSEAPGQMRTLLGGA